MSKKVYNLVVGIVGGLSTIAVAVVTFFNPAYAVAKRFNRNWLYCNH